MSTMTDSKREKIKASLALTKAKRASQSCKVFTLKIQSNKLSRVQRAHLVMMFTEAKRIRNAMVASDTLSSYKHDSKAVLVKNKDGVIEKREIRHLGSQIQQSVQQQVWQDAMSLSARKQKGHKVGRLKFKTQVNSLELKQAGITYGFKSKTKLRVQKFPGLLRVNGASQLEGYELANARLIRKPDGYYLAVTCFKQKEKQIFQAGTAVGLDMGVKTHVTLSDGSEINVLVGETDRLKRLQRKLSRQIKGSNNHYKTRCLIQREYQKMNNKKDEAANQLVHQLLQHELVFMQNEQLASWKKRNGYVKAGRRMQHSILGRVKNKLVHHERVVVLRKNAPTTQWCSCGVRTPHHVSLRVFTCHACGFSESRDIHAAKNMIRLGLKTQDAALEQSQELVEHLLDASSVELAQSAMKQEVSKMQFTHRSRQEENP